MKQLQVGSSPTGKPEEQGHLPMPQTLPATVHQSEERWMKTRMSLKYTAKTHLRRGQAGILRKFPKCVSSRTPGIRTGTGSLKKCLSRQPDDQASELRKMIDDAQISTICTGQHGAPAPKHNPQRRFAHCGFDFPYGKPSESVSHESDIQSSTQPAPNGSRCNRSDGMECTILRWQATSRLNEAD